MAIQLNDPTELIAAYRQQLALHPENMLPKDQESAAATLVDYTIEPEWQKAYPGLIELYDIVCDLEWSNIDNRSVAWKRVAELVYEVERQITLEKPKT